MIVYGHLILEEAEILKVSPEVINQIFDFMVRDFSKYALELHQKTTIRPDQVDFCLKMLRKPVHDQDQYLQLWEDYVLALNGEYEMNP